MNQDEMTPADDSSDDDMTMPPVDGSALVVDEPSAGQQAAQTDVPVLQHAPVAPVAPVTGLPSSADDVDLIEKEWVEKAKEIVESTTGDPYAQAKQLGQMKAEYVRKRYGREIKTYES